MLLFRPFWFYFADLTLLFWCYFFLNGPEFAPRSNHFIDPAFSKRSINYIQKVQPIAYRLAQNLVIISVFFNEPELCPWDLRLHSVGPTLRSSSRPTFCLLTTCEQAHTPLRSRFRCWWARRWRFVAIIGLHCLFEIGTLSQNRYWFQQRKLAQLVHNFGTSVLPCFILWYLNLKVFPTEWTSTT